MDEITNRDGHNFVDKVAKNTLWLTPDDPELNAVRAYAPIGLDPCTQPDNPTKAAKFFTEADNGLVLPWGGYGLVFSNPPYSLTPEDKAAKKKPPIRAWSKKIGDEAKLGVEIIALLPCGARFSTAYWQANILRNPTLKVTCFKEGRVKFRNGVTGEIGSDNNYDSVFYGFNVDRDRFAAAFEGIGALWFVDVRSAPGMVSKAVG